MSNSVQLCGLLVDDILCTDQWISRHDSRDTMHVRCLYIIWNFNGYYITQKLSIDCGDNMI